MLNIQTCFHMGWKTNTWLFSKLKRTNPGFKASFYEEGLGVYLKGLFDTVHGLKIYVLSLGIQA